MFLYCCFPMYSQNFWFFLHCHIQKIAAIFWCQIRQHSVRNLHYGWELTIVRWVRLMNKHVVVRKLSFFRFTRFVFFIGIQKIGCELEQNNCRRWSGKFVNSVSRLSVCRWLGLIWTTSTKRNDNKLCWRTDSRSAPYKWAVDNCRSKPTMTTMVDNDILTIHKERNESHWSDINHFNTHPRKLLSLYVISRHTPLFDRLLFVKDSSNIQIRIQNGKFCFVHFRYVSPASFIREWSLVLFSNS